MCCGIVSIDFLESYNLLPLVLWQATPPHDLEANSKVKVSQKDDDLLPAHNFSCVQTLAFLLMKSSPQHLRRFAWLLNGRLDPKSIHVHVLRVCHAIGEWFMFLVLQSLKGS